MTEPRPALSVAASTWSVEMQIMLLARLAPLGRTHPDQPARRPADGIYVHPSLPAADRAMISESLRPLSLRLIDDPDLDPSQVEVHLRAAQQSPPVRLHIITDSPVRARRMAAALAPLTRYGEPHALTILPLAGRANGLRFGAASREIVDAVAFVTAHLGNPILTEDTFCPGEPDLTVTLAAPAGSAAQTEVPVVVVTDDPEGASEPAALVASLKALGYADVRLKHVNHGMPRPEGFELLAGAAALYGEPAVAALRAQVRGAMLQAGVDLGLYPIEVHGAVLDPQELPAELSALAKACIQDNDAPLAAHIIFPCRRALCSMLRPTAPDRAGGHSVEVIGDDPALTARVAGALADLGFAVEGGPLDPESFETTLEVGAMHAHAPLIAALRGVLDTMGITVPGVDHRPELGRRSRVVLVSALTVDARLRRIAAQSRRHAIHLNGHSGERDELRSIRAGLASEGVRVRPSAHRESGEYEILYGGASPSLLRCIVAVLATSHPALAGRTPALRQAWVAEDRDIFINLPQLRSKVSAAAQPAVDAFAAWRIGPPADATAPQPFLEAQGGQLRVGATSLPIRGEVTEHRADLAAWVVDRTAGEALSQIAGAVARREPALLEGHTATSKTSAILFLAQQLGQPLTRVNLSAHADTAELIGRFLPEPGGGWRWSDGAVVRALKRGEWLVLDEINLADAGVLERLNPLLEAEPSLVLTEHAAERLGPGGTPIHPDFRVFATLNPATYGGRQRLSPALRDRFLTSAVVSLPTEEDLLLMLRRLVLGAATSFDLDGCRYVEAPVPPLYPWAFAATETRVANRLLTQLARLFAGLIASAAAPDASFDAEERPVTTRRGLLSLVREVADATAKGQPLEHALRRALVRTLVARAAHPDHRSALAALMDANGLGPNTWAPGGARPPVQAEDGGGASRRERAA